MTQEQKQLLLKDLCARLPYGVQCEIGGLRYGPYTFTGSDVEDLIAGRTFKPYLRPMSSMTDEEKMEVDKLGVCHDGAFHNDVYDIGVSMEEAFLAISWLLERHFDINYLIERGLALEAPKDMYKTE